MLLKKGAPVRPGAAPVGPRCSAIPPGPRALSPLLSHQNLLQAFLGVLCAFQLRLALRIRLRTGALLPRQPGPPGVTARALCQSTRTAVSSTSRKKDTRAECQLYTLAWPMHGHAHFGADMITLLRWLHEPATEFPPAESGAPHRTCPGPIDQVHGILEKLGSGRNAPQQFVHQFTSGTRSCNSSQEWRAGRRWWSY